MRFITSVQILAVTGLGLLCALRPAVATAADQVGVFFDQAAEQNCIQVEQTETLEAYLFLLEPTSSSVIGWECTLEIDNAFLLEVVLAGQAINVGSGDDFVVGLANPLPASATLQLARLSVMVVAGNQAGFFIHPSTFPSLPGTPVYADGSDPTLLIPMTPKTIGSNSLVAGINLPNCIPDQATWGRVKVIYD